MTTRKKLPELFTESCAKCLYMRVRTDGATDSLSRVVTRISAVCQLGMFDKCVESANLFYFEDLSAMALKTLRNDGFGTGIPDWCPLEDWYPTT